jgi:preprotein translocase subunit SecB
VPKKSSSLKNKAAVNYDSFLKSVKLFAVALDKTAAELDRVSYWQSKDKIREIRASYEANNVVKDHFNVIARIELEITKKTDRAKVLSIDCHYMAHFHAAVGCSQETATKFAQSEAKIIIWPYVRALISDLTARMHIPPVVIPLTLED